MTPSTTRDTYLWSGMQVKCLQLPLRTEDLGGAWSLASNIWKVEAKIQNNGEKLQKGMF